MNKSIILFCCLLLSYSKAIYSQDQEVEKISIQFSDQSLLLALHDLEQVSSAYRFVFQDIDPEMQIVSELVFEQATIFQILNTLLEDTGFDFVVAPRLCCTFWVVVYKTNISADETEPVLISVTGRIYDERGLVPSGFVFKIPENRSLVEELYRNLLAMTDNDGNFYIPSVDKNANILVMEIGGTRPRVVSAKEAERILLEDDVEMLEEVITIGREPQ